ncbi:hypothetical protein GTW69_41560 [Streptomyces sp. SID7760]|uniref:hypothetical protein n=1 Tax=Streptomyces longwoodensis TaxID=68231 RepID=UPI00139DFA0D|nr:hypothetical protein [Streptomyces sp. SID7760]
MPHIEPERVDELRARVAAAARAITIRLGPNALAMASAQQPIRLSGGEADMVASAVVDVLAQEMLLAPQEWERSGVSLRSCLVPGCLRQFDMIASLSGAPPEREDWSSAGWLQHRPLSGHACPEHAQALWTSGRHIPNWHHHSHDDARLLCACGWESGKVQFRGHGVTLWQAHALEVLNKDPGDTISTVQNSMTAEQLAELAVSAQRWGPGLAAGRTKEQLAAGMPDFMRDAVDAHVPHLAALRAAADATRDRYERGLIAWLETLD